MFVLLAIALLVGLVVTFWLVGHLVGLALMLLMAALVAYVADSLVPGRVPYGWPGLALVGLVGDVISQIEGLPRMDVVTGTYHPAVAK